MRKVVKDFDDTPPKLSDAACERKRQDALRDKNQHPFDGPYGHKDVKDKLRELYASKCAFCETNVEAGAPFQVEHYRPKKRVADEPHPGYYWLGYEWSNLLLACPSCNNHKRNYFPIAGQRVSTHPTLGSDPTTLDMSRCRSMGVDLQAEAPYIINPETDPNPASHFVFQYDGIVTFQTQAGQYTIDVCDLNRGALVIERKEVYDTVFNFIFRQFVYFDKQEIEAPTLNHMLREAIRGLLARVNDYRQQYTACTQTYWTNFESLFVSRLPRPDWQKRLRQAYDTVRNE